MATLRDTTRLTEEVNELARRLHEELTDGEVDFARLTTLADNLGEASDYLAETFTELDQIVTERLLSRVDEDTDGGPQSGGGGDDEELSKEELLEQAKQADIPGRSSMTKDELRKALQQAQSLTKDELLERARDAGVAGRSEMSKAELQKALR